METPKLCARITRSGLTALAECSNIFGGDVVVICKADGSKPKAVYMTPKNKLPYYAIVPIEEGYYVIYATARYSDTESLEIKEASVYKITKVTKGWEYVEVKQIANFADDQWSGNLPDFLNPALHAAEDAALNGTTKPTPYYVIPPKRFKR